MKHHPLPEGKLPQELLHAFLSTHAPEDPSLVIGPSVGEDITAVSVHDEELVVLKADPITFAGDRIAFYAVTVNGNDIVTCGAVPRWFLATILLPPGFSAENAKALLEDLAGECVAGGITLCGGHTEITDAVTKPVVSGMMVGTVATRKLLRKQDIRPGDRVVMTKSAGLEGTAIIAREMAARLVEAGMGADAIERAASFLPRIAVGKEAGYAADGGYAVAMHDVTEGGAATGLRELAVAAKLGIHVDLDAVPVLEETREVCRVFGLDPLGLIGSGSLLICARGDRAEALVEGLVEAGIDAAVVATMQDERSGVTACRAGVPVPMPEFAADEITRLPR